MSQHVIDARPTSLQQCAPISVRLAQALQSKHSLSFNAAWIRLSNMRIGQMTAEFQSPSDHVPNDALPELHGFERYFADNFSVQMRDVDAQQLLHTCVKLPIQVICWNANGLRASMPAVHHILQKHRPLALVLTETHLLSRQLTEPWLKTLHAEYHVHASCFPDKNPLASGHQGPLRRAVLPSQNRAGVMIATHKDYIQHQHVSNHQVPSDLRGFLHHVSIHS